MTSAKIRAANHGRTCRPAIRRLSFRTTLALAVGIPALAAANAEDVPFTIAQGNGSATFASNVDTKTFTVTQTTPRAVLDWSQILLQADETLNFVQPNSQSITLNRSSVATPLAFQIDGTINANGQVWLLNPQGTIIGSTGRVNASGFLATTADIDPGAFMDSTGRFVFSGATDATINNYGQIDVPSGYAVLAGRNVANISSSANNEAVISARLGKIALGGGQAFTVDLDGNGLMSFLVSDPAGAPDSDFPNSVSNNGRIVADGGTILMTVRSAVDVIGGVISNNGLVQAQTVNNIGGVITLDAGPRGQISVGGYSSAEDNASVGGVIDATGGSGMNSGGIVLAAAAIDIGASSKIDVSGDSGGTIDLLLPTNSLSPEQTDGAQSISIASGAQLLANASTTGTGGSINLRGDLNNSQSLMQISGILQADGGTSGGDGGTIDIQAYRLEQRMEASARAKAASGLAGNINITSASIDVLGMAPLYLGDDTVAANVPLGFSFNYNGQDYTSVDVSSNGFLTFGNLSAMNSSNPSYCCDGLPLDDAITPRNSVFALWTDLNDLKNPYYTTIVLPDSKKRFILGYYGTREFNNNNNNSFEIILDQDGRIQFNYGDLKVLDHSVTAGVTRTGPTEFTELFRGARNATTGLIDPGLLAGFANKSFEYNDGAFQLLNSVPILPTGNTKILASQVESWLNSGTNVTLRAQSPTFATTGGTGAAGGTAAVDGNVTIYAFNNKSAGPLTKLSLGATGDVVIASGVNIMAAQSGLSVALQSDSNQNGSGSVKLAGTINTGETTQAGNAASILIDGNVKLGGNSALISEGSVAVTGGISRGAGGSTPINLSINAADLNAGSIDLGQTGQLELTLDSESKINGDIVAASLTKSGVGGLSLFGNNVGLGAITFQNGTLRVASTSNLSGGSAPLTMGNANSDSVTTLQLTTESDVEILKPISLAGNSRIEAVGRLTLNGTIDGNFGLTVDGQSDITIGGSPNSAIGGTSKLATFKAYSAKTLTFGSSATIATVGDIKISGATRFVNLATDAAPLKPGSQSRWLIGSGNTNPFAGDTPDMTGELQHDFRFYGITEAQVPSLPSGNGLVYSLQPTLFLSVTGGITKTYDGSTAMPAGSIAFVGNGLLSNDQFTVSNFTARYAKPNAGTHPIVFSDIAIEFTDSSDKPVFGYGLDTSQITGNITPAALTAALTGNITRIYDGTTAATLAANNYVLTGFADGDGASVTRTQGVYD
uniref:beta strand repeat-containing protein n=1 Tax=Sphingorhabdus sp. EL138 TaxID=2073156 RepID=UPI0025CF1293